MARDLAARETPDMRERHCERTLVEMAASADTPAGILIQLSNDELPTVRAAVALNAAAPIEANARLSGDGDERIRILLGTKLASLMPSLVSASRDRVYEATLSVLRRLVADETVRIRAAIADVIKDMPGAPRELVLKLAQDNFGSVSDPIVRLSPLLSAEDLLGLLALGPTPTTAVSIASRDALPPVVCDAIANGVDAEAIRALLENPSAAIREETIDSIVGRAHLHTPWHRPLTSHPRLSARAAQALAGFVADDLLHALAARPELDPAVVRDIRRQLFQRLGAGPAGTQRGKTVDDAMAQAKRLSEEGKLTEQFLLDAVARGDETLLVALLAVAADVPVSTVQRAAMLRSAKGVVSLVWKAGFSMRVGLPLQILLARLSPATVLRPSRSGGFPMNPEEMRWQLTFLA
jgi:uncharacterized protein (DUF2336 family)